MKTKINKQGLTLIEILIATLIFSVALGALLSSLAAVVDIIDFSRDRTIAIADLRNIMETIRATPFDSLVAKFPNAMADGPANNPYANITGGYTLKSEHITVTYVNPNIDPLEIKVSGTWQDKKSHSFSASLSTFRTR